MNDKSTASSDWEKNTVKTTVRLGFWTLGWVVTMAIANFGPKLIWQFNDSVTIVAILLNLAVGAGMILANKRHLNGLDELQQKIQLEAMALSLGVGLIVGLGYSNLDVSNIISADAEISHLVILMGLTYLAGVIAGTRKYR
jgi:hypothetical protein